MVYREEIDGLRALAVLPVILFHAGISGFSGGYVGVDIFFVISGYLITSIILEELKNDKFSIVSFYERRARRILPALSVVLLMTTVAAYILMPAPLLKSYGQSLVSVVTFSSNIFFYLTNGYFSTASDEKPLLHTWSLAVEEQYYLFFPVMMTLLWAWGKKWLLAVIVFIAAASLGLSQYLASKQAVDANFYLIFSRAWELFFGSIVAFLPSQRDNDNKHVFNNIMGLLGLIFIGYAIVMFDHSTPFPSVYTLLPVLGACMIIQFCNGRSLVGKLLSMRVLVFIGLLSYSMYLWHQPIFAFIRMKTIGEPGIAVFALAIAATIVLAYISWKYIEAPFRNKRAFPRAAIFRYSTVALSLFLAAGLVGHFDNGISERFDRPIDTDSAAFSPKREKCHTNGANFKSPEDACRYFSDNVTWATLGDSHTVEPAYALAKRLDKTDQGLVQMSFSHCPPALDFAIEEPGCTRWLNDSVSYLEQHDEIKNVVVGFRHSAYLYGDQLDSYPEVPDDNPIFKVADQTKPITNAEARSLYWKSFSKLIHRLLESGKNVYVIYPMPELPTHVVKAMTPFTIFDDEPMLDTRKTTPESWYKARNREALQQLATLPYGARLHAIQPESIFCEDGYCPATKDGTALYFDDDHLSVTGGGLLADAIISAKERFDNGPDFSGRFPIVVDNSRNKHKAITLL